MKVTNCWLMYETCRGLPVLTSQVFVYVSDVFLNPAASGKDFFLVTLADNFQIAVIVCSQTASVGKRISFYGTCVKGANA